MERGKEHKVLSIRYTRAGWKRSLELELDDLSDHGWRPILSSDGGQEFTVILERDRK